MEVENMNPNLLESYLDKPSSKFTKSDIIKFVEGYSIEMLNFRYVAEDGRLKTLNFVINSKEHLNQVLSCGERVDGSSLFSFIGAGSSDLYVVPRFKTAFFNPFEEIPTLDILCSFYDNTGKPLESAPEYVLKKAHRQFKEVTGYTFKALGELEYYIISKKDELYPAVDQKGYHASAPFIKWAMLRKEALALIASCGGKVKYAHSEVGNFSTESEYFEQHEIEFLPVDVEEAADQLIIAKWILRKLGQKYGVRISFAPKITVGKAGSGMHFHMLLDKDGKNVMVEGDKLSDVAKKVIFGLLDLADSLTAFGNTIPTSYLRLVPHQEAPTNICWGDRNRSVLVRVPLGWIGAGNMVKDANPQDEAEYPVLDSKQTVELRSPDGSADIYMLLAGIVIAAQHGIETPDSLEKAEALYVEVNIFKEKPDRELEALPACCYESAEALEAKREFFEKNDIFPKGMIDNVMKKLKAYDDKDLSERLYGNGDEISKLVDQYIDCK